MHLFIAGNRSGEILFELKDVVENQKREDLLITFELITDATLHVINTASKMKLDCFCISE